jgi:hypothetical protein
MEGFYLGSVCKILTEDHWPDGEIGSSHLVIDDYKGKVFESIGQLLIYLHESYGLSLQAKDYLAFDDNRIDYQTLEDDDGNPLSEKDMDQWKEGKIIAYSGYWTIYIQRIQLDTFTTSEMKELGFQEY